MSTWEFNHLQKEMRVLDRQIEENTLKKENLQKEISQTQSRLEKWDQKYEENTKEVKTAEKALDAINSLFLSLEKELAGFKASIQVNKDSLVYSDLSSYEQSRQVILNQIEEVDKSIVQYEKKKEGFSEKWNWLKKEHAAFSEKYLSSEQKKQSLKTELINCEHRTALFQQKNQSILSAIEDWSQREKEWKTSLEEKNKEMQKLQAQKKGLRDKLEKSKQLSFNVTDSIQDLKKSVESLKTNIHQQESDLKKKQLEASTLYSEWNSLKKLGVRMDAREKGLRFVMQSAGKEDRLLETADAFRLLSPVLEKAVSSYMDSRLKSVFCRDKETALSSMDLLNKKKVGRCRFLLPANAAVPPESGLKKKLKGEPGFKFFLKDNIEGREEIVDLLFARTGVVEDMNTAIHLKKKYPGWCFITLKGEVLTEEGDFIGGEFTEEEMNILAYRRAMEELPLRCEEMNKQAGSLEAQLKKTKTLLKKNIDRISELSAEEGNFQVNILDINKDLEIIHRDEERLTRETPKYQEKISECQKNLQELRGRKESFQKDTQSARQNDLQVTLQQVESECLKWEREKQALSTQKDHFWRELNVCEKELVSLRERKLLLEKSLESEKQREKSNLVHLKEKGARIRDDENKIQQLEERKKALNKDIESKTEKVSALSKSREDLTTEKNKDQSLVIKLHQGRTDTETDLSSLKLQKESLILQKTSLMEKVRERYQLSLESLKESKTTDFDRDKQDQELQKLRNRLSRIGEVNLLALREYEELERENQFYQKQYEDLTASKEKLSQVIKRIDSFCSRKFNEVFEQVNSCFSKVWPALFEGGQAELILVKDPEKNMVGIDIMVQPPGKKIQNMNLLSGGEKAMTAVAVIFSIFLVQPSPFCILDEVDAPLDDVNIARFRSLLAEMAEVSQMIIITHNKYTMQECHHLYGVTMEEKGISKVMSLDMQSARAGKTDAGKTGGKTLKPASI